jgi:adenine phosphoribosyltransferase
MDELRKCIAEIPDFPKKGVLFRDVTTLLQDPKAFRLAIDEMKKKCNEKHVNVIVGIESRGFIFGSIVAHELGVGFVPIRKKGKLPREVVSEEYDLEYGKDSIEMHKDAIVEGQSVMIIDDLLATGGTAAAAARLIESVGGRVVGLGFLMELAILKGREKLSGYDIFSLIQYED